MTVLFHFSLSLTGYEYRRRLAAHSRTQGLPTSRETESLITNRNVDEPSTSEATRNELPTVQKKNFFKTPALYQNAFLYVFSRLFMTTSLVSMVDIIERNVDEMSFQVYIPFWLTEQGSSSIENIAIIPLVSFISSFVASNLFKQIDKFLGQKNGYLLGSVIR
jgi:hypothetical protein